MEHGAWAWGIPLGAGPGEGCAPRSHHGLGNLVAPFALCSAQGFPVKARWQGYCPRAPGWEPRHPGHRCCWDTRRAGTRGMRKRRSLGLFLLFPSSPKSSAKGKSACTDGGKHLVKRLFPRRQRPPRATRRAPAGHGHPALPTSRAFLPPNRIRGRGGPDNQICQGEPRAAWAAE